MAKVTASELLNVAGSTSNLQTQVDTKITSSVNVWTTFSPTGSWVSNTAYTGFYRIVGDTLDCQVHVAVSGAPTSAVLTITLPASKSIDTAKIASAAQFFTPLGTAVIRDSGTATYYGGVVYDSATTVSVTCYNDNTLGFLSMADVTQAAPQTFATGDFVNILFSVPIV